MTPNQLNEMFRLQDRMNGTVNPDWLTAGYNWPRAAFVESAELIEHLGWKWWKKQEPNIPQAQIELIDIWHFALSYTLMYCEGDVEAATQLAMEHWGADGQLTDMSMQDLAQVIGGEAARGSIVLNVIHALAERLGLSDDDIYRLYISKNALNMFRQAHGYKEGAYVKDWSGREDNEALAEILAATPGISYDGLMAALEIEYAKHV